MFLPYNLFCISAFHINKKIAWFQGGMELNYKFNDKGLGACYSDIVNKTDRRLQQSFKIFKYSMDGKRAKPVKGLGN